jgi:hypothetical protein
MSTGTTDFTADVKARAEEIVASGQDIRPRLTDVIAHYAPRSQLSAGGLVALIRAAVDGAREGLTRSVPEDRGDVLRQVVDALGDGLSQTALAGRLALEEAASSFRHYSTEDLTRFRDDLAAVHDLFTETVDRSLSTCKALTTAQVAAARKHIDRVAEHLRTEFEVLNDAVRQHPEAFAREGVQAGVSAGRCAAGSLFQALGRMLQRAGDQMRQGGEPTAPPPVEIQAAAETTNKSKGKARRRSR